jgi:predicted enzyme related to lactoylglutathione lyase
MTDIPRIFRITIQVPDIDEATRFYSSLLGTCGTPIRGGSRHYFDCGSIILALLAPGNGIAAQSSPNDIYFSVEDLSVMHARAARLGCLAQGVVHDEPAGNILVRPWGERSFYAVDPYGNELCFVEAGTEFTGRRRDD